MPGRDDNDRFAAAETRPQFRKPKEQNSKVVLDERFASVLTDPRFQVDGKDKYGRNRNKKKQRVKDELSAFYTVVDDDKNDDNNAEKKPKKNDDNSSTSSSSSDSSKDDNSEQAAQEKSKKDGSTDPASRISYLTALSRGEMEVSSSSSSEAEDDDDHSSADDDSSVEEDPVHGSAGILDPSTKQEREGEIEITYEDSPYVAVMDLDWDNLRAVDVFVILSSFSPPGAVKRVQVFYSDFGLEKMDNELKYGPSPDLWKKKKQPKVEEEGENEGGNEYSNASEQDKYNEEGSDNDGDICGGHPDVDFDSAEYAELIAHAKNSGQPVESDFDPEKLRAYEASRLKYYFAVAEFFSAEAAGIVYKEVDGMEFEHSSATVDMRIIPQEDVEGVVKDRKIRDQASSVPSTYAPPDFIVNALQQTNVECTWEKGDTEREQKLTKYASDQWASIAESDDLRAYLASDNSSVDDDDDDDASDEEANKKGARMRKLLGLDSDDDDDEEEDDDDGSVTGEHKSQQHEESDESEDDEPENKEMSKEVTYVPGKKDLEQRIRSKLTSKDSKEEDLTPWGKYQQKRKEKRRERRQAVRRQRKDVGITDNTHGSEDEELNDEPGDSFFLESKSQKPGLQTERSTPGACKKPSDAELELLLAGDNDEEVARDFDMRGIQRIEKNKAKKLKGSRKRKEEQLAAAVSGQEFSVDLSDIRFSAVLDGQDGRFGIDRTDPNYKETTAMRQILDEQKKRRKRRKKKPGDHKQQPVPPDVVEGSGEKSSGSMALSTLVKSLKTKVANNPQ